MNDALTRLADAVGAGTATDADFDATWPRAMYGEHYYAKQAYNGSLDAAKALHEAVLPKWSPSVGQNVHHGYWFAHVMKSDDGSIVGDHSGLSPDNPARAWLLAIIRALAQVQG